MLFHALEFWIFLPVVLIAFSALPERPGRILLLVASYFFYMWWNPWLVVLILASTGVDYGVGLAMSGAGPGGKRRLLIVSLVCNLGLLGFFKYYNFFAASLAVAVGIPESSFLLQIVLPVGISFYTFQSLSYTIDLYRGHIETVRSFTDFALFVSFFPQLVAGPIVRARTFFSQLYDWKAPSRNTTQQGIQLILFGLIEKMVFADNFARLSQRNFDELFLAGGAIPAWLGTMAFMLQVYFDFSGYSNIAIGCGKLLGFEFPVNFQRPYLATNIAEFWRRWHISLSTWFRDYVFFPLGGSRGAAWQTIRNVMVTMFLVGLWHGASWNFVLWGGYLGVLIGLHQGLCYALEGTTTGALLARPVCVPLRWGATMFAILIAMAIFRFQDFDQLRVVFGELFSLEAGKGRLGTGPVVMIAVSATLAILEEWKGIFGRLSQAPVAVRIAAYVGAFFLLELFSVTDEEIPFVYFQF